MKIYREKLRIVSGRSMNKCHRFPNAPIHTRTRGEDRLEWKLCKKMIILKKCIFLSCHERTNNNNKWKGGVSWKKYMNIKKCWTFFCAKLFKKNCKPKNWLNVSWMRSMKKKLTLYSAFNYCSPILSALHHFCWCIACIYGKRNCLYVMLVCVAIFIIIIANNYKHKLKFSLF